MDVSGPRVDYFLQSEDKRLSTATILLLLAVLISSPISLAFASVFLVSWQAVFVYFLVMLSLPLFSLSALYLRKVRFPRDGWTLPYGLKVAALLAYVVMLAIIVVVLIDENRDPWQDTEELIKEVITDMFIYAFALNGVLVFGFTLLSSTFRAPRKDLAVDVVLAAFLMVMPVLNIMLFFAGT